MSYSLLTEIDDIENRVRNIIVDLRERHNQDSLPDVGSAPTDQPLFLFPQGDHLPELLIDGYPVVAASEDYVFTNSEYPGQMDLASFVEDNLKALAEVLDFCRGV
tara:strand:+ start:4676 stop:4990 length:315 start_codon:yes stop_codon:yes gene_type:complete